MHPIIQNFSRPDGFTITNDRSRVNREAIYGFIARSGWADHRSHDVIDASIAGSNVYSLFEGSKQIGIARVVTDYATFAYLCDVFIDESYRGQGLSKWLMTCIMSYPGIHGIKRFLLFTKDAQGLYEKFGFRVVPGVHSTPMEILNDHA